METHYEYAPKLEGSTYSDFLDDIPENMISYSCKCPRSTGKYNSRARLIQHIKRDGHKAWLVSLNENNQQPQSCTKIEHREDNADYITSNFITEPDQDNVAQDNVEDNIDYIMPDVITELQEDNVAQDNVAQDNVEDGYISDTYAALSDPSFEEEQDEYEQRIINLQVQINDLKNHIKILDSELCHQKNLFAIIVLGALAVIIPKLFEKN
tara:strand:+ start:3804 stop:4433 length:630 start_codon:yes stop_codon:yes gene_type:complete